MLTQANLTNTSEHKRMATHPILLITKKNALGALQPVSVVPGAPANHPGYYVSMQLRRE